MFAVTEVMGRYQVLTEKQRELLALLLPSSDGLRVPKSQNNGLVVEGMLYRLRPGLPWRDLPARFGPGRRCGNGIDATPGMERGMPWPVRGGLTSKVHLACDGDGRLVSVLVGPGQAGDSPM